MTRSELVDRCKRVLAEAQEEVTEYIVAYLELHPDEPRNTLCREIDPDNWVALESRVRRAQSQVARSEEVSATASAPQPNQRASIRSAKAAIRKHPELVQSLLSDPVVEKTVTTEVMAKATPEAISEVVVSKPEVERVVTDSIISKHKVSPEIKASRVRDREKEAKTGFDLSRSNLVLVWKSVVRDAVELASYDKETVLGWRNETRTMLEEDLSIVEEALQGIDDSDLERLLSEVGE